MGLHIAAWLVLLFCSVNSLVLEFGGIYSHPIRYLSFGPYSYRQQGPSAGDSVSGNGSSASAAAAAEAAAAVSFRRKRGIASGLDSIDDIAALAPQLSWYYNWGTQPDNVTGDAAEAAGMEFVPMQWGRWSIEHLDSLVGQLSPRPAALLGFNEPTHVGQSDLEPATAAELWPYLEVVAGKYGLQLGSPSAAGCGADCTYSNPYAWWDAFFGNCSAMYTSGCRVDFMAVHMYTCSMYALRENVQQVWSLYRRPIWITEFNCPNAGGPLVRQIAYAKQAVAYLNSQPAVERYGWFSSRGYGGSDPTMSLLGNGTSTLTWLGKVYTNDSLVAAAPPASDDAAANGTVQTFSSASGRK